MRQLRRQILIFIIVLIYCAGTPFKLWRADREKRIPRREMLYGAQIKCAAEQELCEVLGAATTFYESPVKMVKNGVILYIR